MKLYKKILLSGILATLATPAFADVVVPDSTGFKFTDVKTVPCTSVKDQNKTGTCWCFSGCSFLENEILRKTGKEVDLSEMFIIRKCYELKAQKFVRMYGKTNFGEGGSITDVRNIIRDYGVVPESVYGGIRYGDEKHNHREFGAVSNAYINAIVRVPNKKLSPVWFEGYKGILDAYFGKAPESFTDGGKKYTPETYAKSLGLNLEDYMFITSFTHHPFYTPFVLEVPDNWTWEGYQNVQLDELQRIVENAIENGYSVLWAADVSEGGFKWNQGYAIMPAEKSEKDMDGTELARWVKLSDKDRESERWKIKGPVKEMEITQEVRQQMFDSQETTDDHGMVIVGTAIDQKGNKYFKVKNSWDTNQVYDGYFYVSIPYFRAKTLSLAVNKEAVPTDIAKKLK